MAFEGIVGELEKFGGFPEVVMGGRFKETLTTLARLLIFKELPLLENVDPTDLWIAAEALSLSQTEIFIVKRVRFLPKY